MFQLPYQACFERANRSSPKRLCATQKGRPLYGGSVGLTGLTTVFLISLWRRHLLLLLLLDQVRGTDPPENFFPLLRRQHF